MKEIDKATLEKLLPDGVFLLSISVAMLWVGKAGLISTLFGLAGIGWILIAYADNAEYIDTEQVWKEKE